MESSSAADDCVTAVKSLNAAMFNSIDATSALEKIKILARDDENQDKLGAAGCCKAVVLAMKTHPANAELCEQGCAAIFNLSLKHDIVREALGSAGGCEVAVHAIRRHMSNAAVCRLACMAIRSLAHNNSVNKGALIGLDARSEINKVLTNYAWHEQICEIAKGALSSLGTGPGTGGIGTIYNSNESDTPPISTTFASFSTGSLFGKAGNPPPVDFEECVSAVNDLKNGVPDAASACEAIRVLAKVNREQLGRAGCCEILVDVLNANLSEAVVCKKACAAMVNLSANNDANKQKLGMAGACESIITAMTNHMTNVMVCHEACGVIRNLCNNHDNNDKFGDLGACELVISTIKTHIVTSDFCRQACWALDLLCTNPHNRDRLNRADARTEINKILSHHASHSQVCYQARGTLNKLGNAGGGSSTSSSFNSYSSSSSASSSTSSSSSSSSTPSYYTASSSSSSKRNLRHFDMTVSDEIAAAVSHLKACISDADETARSCENLRFFAKVPAKRDQIGYAGGCEAVVSAMTTHLDNLEVCKIATAAMRSLSYKHKEPFSASGGCEAVVEVMNTHITNLLICVEGCAAIQNLSMPGQGYDANTHKLGTAGACEAVCTALNLHIGSAAACENACGAIWNLAYSNMANKDKFRRIDVRAEINKVLTMHYSDSKVCNIARGAMKTLF